ncbi:hypothetical protein D1B31_05290 [Neobacillus notoginsengisoli]|uniref:Uncharacterized protein n=1 Tax=Neobacillus notoginsengisoli TaxID=1578198 RepID=A0A417YWT4_9BACI|nr:hypothetical protein [Neobacillus notoginsengisoli]RHW42057.1 hypothetical protein D1B31_05290 [Neobacillus notoginsengisoli]
MDKVTSIAFILYHATDDSNVKARAVDLLNGETDLRELKADTDMLHLVETAEAMFKKRSVKKKDLQKFVEENLLVEA